MKRVDIPAAVLFAAVWFIVAAFTRHLIVELGWHWMDAMAVSLAPIVFGGLIAWCE